MMITGYNDLGEPILTYSSGEHSLDSLKQNVGLANYHILDTKQGGNHTENHYFRYNYPSDGHLPEVTVRAKRKSGGKLNYIKYF